MNRYISIVPIRAGSKGLKDKNTRILNGKPLYLYAVEQGIRTTNQCIISTDIESVISSGFPLNIQVNRRKNNLCQDQTLMDEVLLDLFLSQDLEEYNAVLLQATSPLRSDSDVLESIKMFESHDYHMIMSACRKDSKVMKYGFIKDSLFVPLFKAENLFKNRQNLEYLFSPNGAIYIFSIKEFIKQRTFPSQSIGAYVMPKERSLDIDAESDLKLAESYLEHY